MSDSFFLEFCDSMAMESSGKGGGMPIPRGPSARGVGIVGNHYPDFTMALQMEDHSPQTGQHCENRDISFIPTNFGQDTTFGLSPMGPNSPSLWPPQTMDLDVDIKLEPEPLDDLLSVEDFLPSNFTSNDGILLDDVSFDDLLMPEQFSSPTMDNPQSPHTMMAVHPDEVLAARSYPTNMPSSPYHPQSSSMGSPKVETVPQPIKAESNSLFSLLASSFPPQGGGWHDPLLTSSSLPGHQQVPAQLGSIEECPSVVDHVQNIQPQQQQPQQHPFQHTHSMSPHQHQATGSTSALQELLLRSPSAPLSPQHAPSPIPSPQEPPMGQSVPRPTSLSAANPLLSARLSSSAPTRNFSLEQAWQRREPRQHLLSTGSLAEELDGSTSSLSTVGGILSPSGHDLSIDEGLDSEDESDNEHYDSESDNDSIVSEDTGSLSGSMSKKERYFWQYNVQAKGPKGQRVTINQQQRDPYSLPSVMDPVFSPLCSIQGIKHSGKARRGDGNDLTPNPRKLVSIGRELEKLNKTINDMTPVSELPFNVRPKSRKEKNKLASRACRLKKKAQHEANKIKLYGLEQEHKSMLNIIDEARALIHNKMEPQGSTTTTTITANTLLHHNQHHHHAAKPIPTQPPQGTADGLLMQNMEKLCKMKSKHRIAGHTTDFVNKVIESCQNGNYTGGLEEVTKIFFNTNLATSPPSNMGMGGFSPH